MLPTDYDILNQAADARFRRIREKEKNKVQKQKQQHQCVQHQDSNVIKTAPAGKKELEKSKDTKKNLIKEELKTTTTTATTTTTVDSKRKTKNSRVGWNTWKCTTCDKVNNLLIDPTFVCSICGRKQVYKEEDKKLRNGNITEVHGRQLLTSDINDALSEIRQFMEET